MVKIGIYQLPQT